MTTFKAAREVILDPRDRKAFEGLGHNRDFKIFREVAENYILQLTHNVAVGQAVSRETRYAELDKIAGFTEVWKKLMDLLDNKEHHNVATGQPEQI